MIHAVIQAVEQPSAAARASLNNLDLGRDQARESCPQGAGQRGGLPSTTDVGSVTGGLPKRGLGYLPRRMDALLGNLFGSAFFQSGVPIAGVYRFSGSASPRGAWGVVVKEIDHDSGVADVDLVTGPFGALFLSQWVSGRALSHAPWRGVRRAWIGGLDAGFDRWYSCRLSLVPVLQAD